MLRLCLSAAAAVLLFGFDDVGGAKLAAFHESASNEMHHDYKQAKQAASSRELLQAQQDEIVGTDSIDLTDAGGLDALRVRTRTKKCTVI